ncbi:hypothetical protein C8Q74DRAFT_900344 [Fomes fomentarius]|nr:hypothetical protein C8Q74DRAFT_900344 [Fomes fomentarius]
MRVLGTSKPFSLNQVHTPGTQHLPILGKHTQGLVEEVVIRRRHAVSFLQKPLTEPFDAEKNDRALRRAKKEVRAMILIARELDAALLQEGAAPEADSDDDMEDALILPTPFPAHSLLITPFLCIVFAFGQQSLLLSFYIPPTLIAIICPIRGACCTTHCRSRGASSHLFPSLCPLVPIYCE